jgi:hypothetical protein
MTKRSGESSAIDGSTHQLDLLGGSEAESERAREPAVADQELRRSNAGLEELKRATADGLGALDQHTQGRLRELVERAGDELAALIDLVLNNREASA